MNKPATTLYSRGVGLVSAYVCTFAGVSVILSDWGKQEHVLTPVQQVFFRIIDSSLGVTPKDIDDKLAQIIEAEKTLAKPTKTDSN